MSNKSRVTQRELRIRRDKKAEYFEMMERRKNQPNKPTIKLGQKIVE